MAHLEDELLAGHLQGALDALDQALVAEHLAACGECAERLPEIRALLALLPESIDDMMPPAGLGRSLLAFAAQETAEVQPPASVAELRPAGSVRPRLLPLLGMAASVLVASFLGAFAWSLLTADADVNRGLLEAITGIDKGVVLPMAGTELAPGVRAALLAPEGADRVYVVASNVPPPPAGQAYHLYLFEDGKPLPAIVLQPDARGRINAVLDAPLARFNAMEVDIQPIGASAPGGPAVLKSNLP